jgi:DNA-binding CsgD family transcriptional regulator
MRDTPLRREKPSVRRANHGRLQRWTRDAMPAHKLLGLFTATNPDALIHSALGVLQAAVACDFASAFFRSDDGAFKDRDSLGRGYGPDSMRRCAELNPHVPWMLSNPSIKLLPTRVGLPFSDEELHRTPFYREIMKPQGWRHAVALCFWDERAAREPLLVASVHRSEGRCDFSDTDLATLNSVHPFIDCAVNRLQERAVAASVRNAIALAAQYRLADFAVLDRNLFPVHATPAARRFFAAWPEQRQGSSKARVSRPSQVPRALAEACRELCREWSSRFRYDRDAKTVRTRRVCHPNVPGLAALVTIVCPNREVSAEPSFILHFDQRLPAMPFTAAAQSLLRRLTVAERDVAVVLADGPSNQEIADRIGKSVHAVKFLLHRIYQKTGLSSRAALVANLRSPEEGPRQSEWSGMDAEPEIQEFYEDFGAQPLSASELKAMLERARLSSDRPLRLVIKELQVLRWLLPALLDRVDKLEGPDTRPDDKVLELARSILRATDRDTHRRE